jgi:hypothetical protein
MRDRNANQGVHRPRAGNVVASHHALRVFASNSRKNWPRVGSSFVFQRVSRGAITAARHDAAHRRAGRNEIPESSCRPARRAANFRESFPITTQEIHMATPNLDVTIQPTDGTHLLYLPIAAKSKGEPEHVKIVLRLKLKNAGTTDLTLKGITFSYPGSSHADSIMQGVKIAVDPSGEEDPNDGVIKAGTTATWSNGVVDLDDSEEGQNSVRNDIYLPVPAPSSIAIKISCHGFSDPKTVTLDLRAYTDPTGFGALRLPISQMDLDEGEYLVTSGRHWANGGANGTQIYAHDIGVQAKLNGEWTSLRDGVTQASNSDHRIWGKPLRALANGIVEACEDHHEDNAFPGAERPAGTPGTGNSMRIRHGNITVIYAHLKKGSIPAALKQPNAAVNAGDKIGLAGNSGRSSGPHLHLEGRDTDTNTLRGLPFRMGSVLDREKIQSDQSGPWVMLTADGICRDSVAIRPGWRVAPVGPVVADFELEELVAEVFGGVSKGGDGFIIVGGKLQRVPPRTPKWKLLEAMASLGENVGDARRTSAIGRSIEQIGAEIAGTR